MFTKFLELNGDVDEFFKHYSEEANGEEDTAKEEL